MTAAPNWDPDAPVQFVRGVGPRRAAALEREGIRTARDLLYHFPRRHLDRTTVTRICDLKQDEVATVVGRVLTAFFRPTRGRPFFQVEITDDTGILKCVWFQGAAYMKKAFAVGEWAAFHAKVDFFRGYQLVHPEYDRLGSGARELFHTGGIIPLYPSSQGLKEVGLDSRGFRRLVRPLLEYAADLEPEPLPEGLRTSEGVIGIADALRWIHFAPDKARLDHAVARLKFDEHFFLQLLMALRKSSASGIAGRPFTSEGPYAEPLLKRLGFALTGAQDKALKEIRSDLASGRVMNRLLQGDVGSGKTAVALLAAAIVAGNRSQVAVMAPTEILAHQHYQTFLRCYRPLRIPVALVVGRQDRRERAKILTGAAEGRIPIVVGTHAILQEEIRFRDLGLVVIDEQQRFGVVQRAALVGKGYNPHVLVMTATPIPRTLAISYFGDMDLSLIDEMPLGRKPVTTRIVTEDVLPKVYQFIADQLTKGRQCVVVYPVIEGSESSDWEAAESGYKALATEVFTDRKVALLHGRMKPKSKDEVMEKFAKNEIQILISTTVVEVGIDVPNATVMVIENAERFGLAQLHQLRGRVGRGKERGVCVLVERRPSEDSRRRLEVLARTADGFEISDEDLKLRGPGEFFGVRQHGFAKWKIADLVTDGPIIREARRAAFSVVELDPQLKKPEHQQLRKRFLADYQQMQTFVNIG